MARNVRSRRNLDNLSDPNAACHGYGGGVTNNGNEIMGTPKVFVIYWSDYVSQTPLAAQMMDAFISTLITSPYMDGLAQYGVNPGVFLGSITLSSSQFGPNSTLKDSDIQSQIGSWIGANQIPQPDTTHYDLLYIVFTPETCTVLYDGLSSKTDFSGYHGSFHYNQFLNAGKTNAFYAVIPLGVFPPDDGSPGDIVRDLTTAVSHEMVEAFTDRNDNGWYAGVGSKHCEIGDICEMNGFTSVFSWPASLYWSNSDQTCIPNGPIANYLILDTNNQFDSHGFPGDAFAQLQAMQAANMKILNVAFTQQGGWIVIAEGNAYFASGIPQDCFEMIGTMVAEGNTLKNVIFPPSGGWLILGENNWYFASGIPDDCYQMLGQPSYPGGSIQNVVFSPSGEWIILGENNSWWNSSNLELGIFEGMSAFGNNGGTIQKVVFLPNWCLLVIGTNGDYQWVGAGFPIDVWNFLFDFVGGASATLGASFRTGSSLANLVIGQPL